MIGTRLLPIVLAGAALVQLAPAVTGMPGLVRSFAPRSAGVGRRGHLALTFDDGPHPDGTPAVLRTLADWRCSATFFMIAAQARRYPDLVKRVVEDGHEVAVHGWDHRPLPLVPPLLIGRQLQDAVEVISGLTEVAPRWYRPPYGVASGPALAAAAGLGLRPMWWTRWGRDWSPTATAHSIADLALTSPGKLPTSADTVLLHDSDTYGTRGSWRHTVCALPLILGRCADAGVTVGPVREHLRSHGPTD